CQHHSGWPQLTV
nr:immunoglobulin light chain junction region [Macaca mulatta]